MRLDDDRAQLPQSWARPAEMVHINPPPGTVANIRLVDRVQAARRLGVNKALRRAGGAAGDRLGKIGARRDSRAAASREPDQPNKHKPSHDRNHRGSAGALPIPYT